MKAMILAAGLGERMRPLTDTTPKPLLTAGPKMLIEYHLEKLAAAGFQQIVINVSWLAHQITDTLGTGARWNLHIDYSHEETPLETAGGIRKALKKLLSDGEKQFAVVNGDVWSTLDYQYLRRDMGDAYAHLFLAPNPPHHVTGDFTLNPKTGTVGLPAPGTQTRTFSGISILTAQLFEFGDPSESKLGNLFKQAMIQHRITGEALAGEWYDIGTPERLAHLDKKLSAH